MPKSKAKMCYVNHTALQKHREKPNFLFLCHYYCLSKNTNSVFNSFWHRDRKNAKFLCQIGESKVNMTTLCKPLACKNARASPILVTCLPVRGVCLSPSVSFVSPVPKFFPVFSDIFPIFSDIFRYFSDIFPIFFRYFPIFFRYI